MIGLSVRGFIVHLGCGEFTPLHSTHKKIIFFNLKIDAILVKIDDVFIFLPVVNFSYIHKGGGGRECETSSLTNSRILFNKFFESKEEMVCVQQNRRSIIY